MKENELIDLLNDIPFDLRVEVVVADILNSGYEATDLFIRPIGLFQRRFQKDIQDIEQQEFHDSQKAIYINSSRDGLYDMLPQAIFHNPPSKETRAFKGVQDMISDYRKRIVEEKEVRKFFTIYEIEFYRQRIANAMSERKLSEAISVSMDDKEFLSYWRLPDVFDSRQKGILFYLFPLFNRIRGSIEYMNEVYRLLLQQDIYIERSKTLPVLEYDNSGLELGKMVLSVNSIIGKRYPYYYPSFNINIRRLKKEFFYDYLPGGRCIKAIEKLNEYFIPIFCEAEIIIETEKTKWLLGESNKEESRLGYSAVI